MQTPTANANNVTAQKNSREPSFSDLSSKLSDTFKKIDTRWNDLHMSKELRKHPTIFVLAGTGLLAMIGAGLTLGLLEQRRRNTWNYRLTQGLKSVLSMF